MLFGMVLAAGLLALSPVHAEEVKLEHKGLTLNASLEKADASWPAGPVVLMVHGTLAHNGMEIITTLQGLFADRGVSSLAINLSLGLNDRHGMYDCKTPHTHKHTDALDEIATWLGWLKGRGVERVVLLGHSRGGNQAAWFVAERGDPLITQLVLVAPATWSAEYAAADYEKRYGTELAPLVAKAEQMIGEGQATSFMEQVDFIYCEDTQATAEAFVSYHGPDSRMDTPTLVPKISKPMLVFVGSEDQVVAGLEDAMTPLAEKDAVELEVIEGADHFFRDLYAEDLVDRSVEFIGAQ
jgi:pimeloyl-ACP methyl ester carboxylesterase